MCVCVHGKNFLPRPSSPHNYLISLYLTCFTSVYIYICNAPSTSIPSPFRAPPPCPSPRAPPFSVQESEDLKDLDKAQLEELGAEIEESLFAVHKDVNHR